jgi:hypothetical protein
MFTNVQYAKAKCARFIVRQTSILKDRVSTLLIQSRPTRSTQGNTNIASDLGFYSHKVKSLLTVSVHSGLERPKRSTRTVKRLVRGVALVIGITLFLPVEQVSNAQLVPIQSAKQYAKSQVSGKEYSCLSKLWGKESAWNHKADNPHSTAYGIPQILGMKERDPIKQVDLGLKYIRHRHNTPCQAWKTWKRNGGWY